MGFPRQEYWGGLPSPPLGDLPDPGIEPTSPALAGEFFTTGTAGKPKNLFKVQSKRMNNHTLSSVPRDRGTAASPWTTLEEPIQAPRWQSKRRPKTAGAPQGHRRHSSGLGVREGRRRAEVPGGAFTTGSDFTKKGTAGTKVEDREVKVGRPLSRLGLFFFFKLALSVLCSNNLISNRMIENSFLLP